MTLVKLDTSHKTVVAVCYGAGCPWRRVVLVADKSRLLLLAAEHASTDHPSTKAAGELRRRAEKLAPAGRLTSAPPDLTA
jgi:hypothetical protein